MRIVSGAATPGWFWRAAGCAGAAVLFMYGLSVLLGRLMGPLRLIGQSVACQSNVFRLARGFRMYAADYDDHFPPAAQWMDRTFFYVDKERYLHCPAVSAPGEPSYGYAMNLKVEGAALSKIPDPDSMPMVYDSTNMARSAADALSTLPRPGRHITRPRGGSPSRRGDFVGYAAGNARILLDDMPRPKGP